MFKKIFIFIFCGKFIIIKKIGIPSISIQFSIYLFQISKILKYTFNDYFNHGISIHDPIELDSFYIFFLAKNQIYTKIYFFILIFFILNQQIL